MSNWQNRHLFITGVTTGIGEQLAVQAMQSGAHVFGVSRSKDRLELMAQAFPGQFDFAALDLAKKDSWVELRNQMPSTIDTVILNAGTCEYIDDGAVDSDLVERVFSINFFANVYAAEYLLAANLNIRNFVIVSSSASFVAFPRAEAYGASKAALNYFYESLLLNYPTIQFQFVYPGFVETPLTDKNDFPMPSMVSSKYAADKILSGIITNKLTISFPKTFTLFLKIIARLPLSWRVLFSKKLMKQ